MSGNVLKNRDLLARAPLYVMLPKLVDLAEIKRFQGTLFARSDYLERSLQSELSVAGRSSEARSIRQAEHAMLEVALEYLSGDALSADSEKVPESLSEPLDKRED